MEKGGFQNKILRDLNLDTKTYLNTMATCISFLRVPDIAQTINWYERIGFKCVGKHQEPGCALDWAMLDLEGATFMLYPDERSTISKDKDAGLYFYMKSIDELIEVLK